MGLAAGGLIKQSIVRDKYLPTIWEPENGIILNVQILNSAHFEEIMGFPPPPTPVTAKKYADYGFPYFDIYDEKPSGVSGDFADVKSVSKMDLEAGEIKEVAEVSMSMDNRVVLLDDEGKQVDFRTVRQMEEDVVKRFGKPEV